MTTFLSTHAVEKSTYVITAALTDEAGTALTPNSGLTWTLTDTLGTVVNGKTAQSLTASPTVYIVLSGNDLLLDDSLYFGTERIVTIQGTYNTTIGGQAQTNLPLKREIGIYIDPLVAVS